MFETLVLDVEDGVATVTLNRPAKLNAFQSVMRDELVAAFDVTDADDAVRAVIVTGAGRAFCAGADLSGGGFESAEHAAETPLPDSGGVVTMRIFRSRKPVIAAVNGPAVGIGATMTLPMDIRLASSSARMAFPFARRGITPDGAASWFLPRAVGISTAAEWVYTGRMIEADELLAAGLVRAVLSPNELLPAARTLAAEIAANAAPVSVAVSRRLLWQMLGAAHPMEAHIAESRALHERTRSADAAEGVGAFLEKRSADFPMRVSEHALDLFPGVPEPAFRSDPI
ncbi:enoyl-CoA hydratase-related protein [Actinophytocola sp.]|uniref:enoyl-CoA hydratase-related protein n=1 Tax=Actinophytocola sp. TaxID=1872138 RepID=UPI00345BD4F1